MWLIVSIISNYILSCYGATGDHLEAYVNTRQPLRRVPAEFLSVSLDTHIAKYRWSGLVEPLAEALAPAYLRFGGTVADLLIFETRKRRKRTAGSNGGSENVTRSKFTFTGQQLDQIYDFASKAGLQLIFDLNLLERSGHEWDPTNAIQLLQYASEHGYQIHFELGNEPNLYPGNFNITLSGAQIADDYHKLREILNTFPLFHRSQIIGPSTGRTCWHSASKLIHDFVQNGGANNVDAVTFHFYYGNGRTVKLEDFLNATLLDTLLCDINNMKKAVHDSAPIWLSETSSAYGGGAPNLSNTFAAGFVWLDKLGLAAREGIDVVVRQALYNGHYALLDDAMNPYPDYWLTLLYKRLVGEKILTVDTQPVLPHVRLYGACKNKDQGVIIYGINLASHEVKADFPQFKDWQAKVFALKEAKLGDLRSRHSTLNGKLLDWHANSQMPNLEGKETPLPVVVPGYSQFFIDIPVKIDACS